MTARASGWLLPIGTCHGIAVSRIEAPTLTWDRISIDEMRLSRVSALMIVQGIRLGQLFPPDLTIYDGVRAVLWFLSPPLLIQREEVSILQVPPKLRGVVLGVVVHAKDLSEEQIRAEMLASVLG